MTVLELMTAQEKKRNHVVDHPDNVTINTNFPYGVRSWQCCMLQVWKNAGIAAEIKLTLDGEAPRVQHALCAIDTDDIIVTPSPLPNMFLSFFSPFFLLSTSLLFCFSFFPPFFVFSSFFFRFLLLFLFFLPAFFLLFFLPSSFFLSSFLPTVCATPHRKRMSSYKCATSGSRGLQRAFPLVARACNCLLYLP